MALNIKPLESLQHPKVIHKKHGLSVYSEEADKREDYTQTPPFKENKKSPKKEGDKKPPISKILNIISKY